MKLKLSILLLITLSLPLFSLDIAVVPLERLGLESDDTAETLEEELVRAVEEQDTLDALNMIMIGTNSPVASLLDAASTAVRNSRDYLLYGAVVSNPDWIEVRLSLYERESDSIRTVFYDKAASERFEEVPEELALRIVKFVYGAYGIEDRRLYTPDPAYLEAYGELGYWGLFPGEWNDVMTGFFHGGFGVSVGLPSPGLVRENFELYPCFGFLFDYAMGANRPDYESATYHSFQFAVPLEASCRFNNGHARKLRLRSGLSAGSSEPVPQVRGNRKHHHRRLSDQDRSRLHLHSPGQEYPLRPLLSFRFYLLRRPDGGLQALLPCLL